MQALRALALAAHATRPGLHPAPALCGVVQQALGVAAASLAAGSAPWPLRGPSRGFVAQPAEAAPREGEEGEPVRLTANAARRIRELLGSVASQQERALRLTVESGGCSGFSYKFDLAGGPEGDDRLFEDQGAALIVDSVSYEFVRGATVDFTQELIKSTFEVVANPNSTGKCGCGASFTPKDL